MRTKALLSSLFLTLLFPSQTLAVAAKHVQIGQLAAGIEVSVTPGYGLVLDFSNTHGLIEHAWLAHIGRFTISSNGHLCPPVSSGQECSNVGANLIFVRLIDPLNIPGLPPSLDGGTLLTLQLMQTDGTQKQLQIGLHPAQGKPQYTLLNVEPDSFKSTPLLMSAAPKIAQPTRPIPTAKIIQPTILQPAPIPTNLPSPVRKFISTSTNRRVNSNALLSQPSRSNLPAKQPILNSSPAPTSSPGGEQTNLELVVHQSDGRQRRYKVLLNPSPEPSQLDTTTNSASVPNPIHSSITSPNFKKPLPPKPVAANSQTDANAAVFGLRIANTSGQIRPGTKIWKQVNTAIFLMRRGEPKEHAADKAGLSLSLLNQLIAWGQNRP